MRIVKEIKELNAMLAQEIFDLDGICSHIKAEAVRLAHVDTRGCNWEVQTLPSGGLHQEDCRVAMYGYVASLQLRFNLSAQHSETETETLAMR